MHLSHDIQQFMLYSYIQAGSQQLLVIEMVNTSTVDGDMGTTFPGRQTSYYACVSTHVQKAFNFELCDFSRNLKAVLGQKRFIFHAEKTSRDIH